MTIRNIIFSACGYGNIGDDAIMLGTARYLITRKKAKDLFVFTYTPKEIQQTLEKSGLTALATIYSGYFFGLMRTMLSSKKKVILIGGGTLITNRTFFPYTILFLQFCLSYSAKRFIFLE